MRIKKPKINPLISEGLFEPCAIAVNPEKRYVFWSDLSTGTIERAYMDGKHRTKIAENYFGVKSIAIDYHENRLYFTSENSIFISDLNGKDIQTVVKLHNPPFGITIMNKHIFYIADSSFKSIRKTSRQTLTSNYFTIVGGQFLRTLTDVRYVADDVQLGQSVCIESKCSFLCLPNKKGYGCACPPQEDCKDGTTTVEIPSKVQSSNQHVSDKGLSSKPTKKAVTTINCGPQSNCFNSSNSSDNVSFIAVVIGVIVMLVAILLIVVFFLLYRHMQPPPRYTHPPATAGYRSMTNTRQHDPQRRNHPQQRLMYRRQFSNIQQPTQPRMFMMQQALNNSALNNAFKSHSPQANAAHANIYVDYPLKTYPDRRENIWTPACPQKMVNVTKIPNKMFTRGQYERRKPDDDTSFGTQSSDSIPGDS